MSVKRFLGFAVAAAGTVLMVVLLWRISGVLLLAFGAILVAMLLNIIAEPFRLWTLLPEWVCLILSGVIVATLLGGTGWIFGSQLSAEFSDVLSRATAGLQQIRGYLQEGPAGRFILSQMNGTTISVTAMLSRMFSLGITLLAALIVMFISAAYLAAQPDLYRRGVVLLFPPPLHALVADTLDAIGGGLRLWLLGQLIEMIIIGLLSTLAVSLIGLHSPLALGLIAAITEFIPYLGPVLAAVPATLVAVTQGHGDALWTIAAYTAIHQAEGNLIQPLIQRKLVYIPPAVMLLGIAAVGSIFGLIGFLFAAPIVVTIFVTVKKLYIRNTLKEPTRIPGDAQPPDEDLGARRT